MAKKITQDDILTINRLYLKYKTYAAVARETGFSAGTVKKYIVDNFIDPEEIEIKKFNSIILPIEETKIVWDLQLTTSEEEEIKELWKEISI